MKVQLDFEYLQAPEEGEPKVIETKMEQLPNTGEHFWYDEILYMVEERIWHFKSGKIEKVVIYFKRVD